MKNKILALSVSLILAIGIWQYVHAVSAATIVSSQGTPYALIAVATNADSTVDMPDNDVMILHTGVQSDGTTASAATDYITVMDAFASDGTTGTTMAASYAAGLKLNIRNGQAVTLRGCDTSYGSVGKTRAVIIRAVGNGAMVQFVKGSQFGSKQ